jgi:hypothetical protein
MKRLGTEQRQTIWLKGLPPISPEQDEDGTLLRGEGGMKRDSQALRPLLQLMLFWFA